jgi:hypothetical protein
LKESVQNYAKAKSMIGLLNEVNGEFLLLSMIMWIDFISAYMLDLLEWKSNWIVIMIVDDIILFMAIFYLAAEAHYKVCILWL